MPDDVTLGKSGLSESFIAHARTLLARKELVKVRFSDVEGAERKNLAREICAALGAECVQVLGRTLLLYRAKDPRDVNPTSGRAP